MDTQYISNEALQYLWEQRVATEQRANKLGELFMCSAMLLPAAIIAPLASVAFGGSTLTTAVAVGAGGLNVVFGAISHKRMKADWADFEAAKSAFEKAPVERPSEDTSQGAGPAWESYAPSHRGSGAGSWLSSSVRNSNQSTISFGGG